MAFEPPEILSDETQDATGQRKARRAQAAGAARPARLRAAFPRELDVSIDLGLEPAVVGRAPDDPTSVAIHDAKISRAHFSIEWDPALGRHVGRDLGSRNGSWVDGHRATAGWFPLDEGSVVRVGDIILVYEKGHTLEHEDAPAISRRAVPGDALGVRDLRSKMAVAAPDVSPALIVGETGTGKEQIARELHRASGRPGRFVAINCATLSEQLIESQLFGHVKGAFTGATSDQEGLFDAAEGGTLFLDEIGEMPLSLQPKLLRAIQEREITPLGSTKTLPVDARVVAATHRDLEARARDGRFRQDLYGRLALWALPVPSLRERKSDVPAWLDLMFDLWLEERDRPKQSLAVTADAAETLLLHDWPENLRGLSRLVHEIAAKTPNGEIDRKDLPEWVRT